MATSNSTPIATAPAQEPPKCQWCGKPCIEEYSHIDADDSRYDRMKGYWHFGCLKKLAVSLANERKAQGKGKGRKKG